MSAPIILTTEVFLSAEEYSWRCPSCNYLNWLSDPESEVQCHDCTKTFTIGPKPVSDLAELLINSLIDQHRIRVRLDQGYELPPWAVNMIEAYKNQKPKP